MTCYEKFGAIGLINEKVLKRIGALFDLTGNYVLEIYPVVVKLKRISETRWKAYIAFDPLSDVRTADVITFLDLDEILTNYFNVSLYTLTNDIVIRILGFCVIKSNTSYTYIWKGEFGTEIKLKETPSSDAKYSCTINSFGNVKKIGCVSTLKELDAMLKENDLEGIF